MDLTSFEKSDLISCCLQGKGLLNNEYIRYEIHDGLVNRIISQGDEESVQARRDSSQWRWHTANRL